MKSYHLEGMRELPLSDRIKVLDDLLPRQQNPWVLFDDKDDPVAYFYFSKEGKQPCLQADISGRHYHEPEAVTAILERLQTRLGGQIIDNEGWPFVRQTEVIDITDRLLAAETARHDWNGDRALSLARAIAATTAVIDWEPPGEAWLRILSGANLIAIIHSILPLAFVRHPLRVNAPGVIVVDFHINSLPEFCIDPVTFRKIFSEPSPSTDLGNLSLDDLWYATLRS